MSALLAKGVLVLTLLGAKPGEYTERGLCDLWAGAQCHATSCKADGKKQCAQASAPCRTASSQPVPQERADKVSACAKALLVSGCGGATPAECADVTGP